MKLISESALWKALDKTSFKDQFKRTFDQFGIGDRNSLSELDTIAARLLTSGNLRRAKTIEEFVLARKQQMFGADNPETLKTLLALARIFTALGDPIRANQLLHGLYKHLNTAYAKNWEPNAKAALTRIGKTLPVVLGTSGEAGLDLDHLPKNLSSNLLATQTDAALTLHGLGQRVAARRILDSVLQTAPRLLGRKRETLGNRLHLSNRVPVLAVGNSLQRALRFDSDEILGPNEPDTAVALANIASSLRDFGAIHALSAEKRSSLKGRLAAEPVRLVPETKAATPDRLVNVWLSSRENRIIAKHQALKPKHDYLLHLSLGRKLAISAVENPMSFPVDKLPPDPVGHWLEVLAVSGDFVIEKARHWLFLPARGEAFVCSCRAGQQHTCKESERRRDLEVPISIPSLERLDGKGVRRSGSRRAHLRIALYFQKNLVQSLRLRATIAPNRSTASKSGYSVRVDYSLTAPLFDVSFLPARSLNILTNDNGDESHKIVFNGDEKDPISFDIESQQVGSAIAAARTTLSTTGIKPYGGKFGAQIQYENLYNAENGKSKADFVADLRSMADFGYLLWATLFSDREDDRKRIRAHLAQSPVYPAVIQISRVEHTNLMFPWAMVYDIPLESSTSHELCKCLDNWGKIEAPLDHCPFEHDPHRANVICPFGFWGFKHIIELPPSVPRGQALPMMISKRDSAHKPEVLMGISRELDAGVTKKHTKALEALASFDLVAKDSLAEFKTALSKDQLEFVYFYCHGKRKELPGSSAGIPLLAVGGATDSIIPPDIITWQDRSWSQDHWKETSPLVFINGCHTAELTPELLVNFVDTFIGVHASGVIGTEIMLLQNAAGEVAEKIFSRLNIQDEVGNYGGVGQAVREMRLHFLNKGSLLGLAYTPYCSADLKLAD